MENPFRRSPANTPSPETMDAGAIIDEINSLEAKAQLSLDRSEALDNKIESINNREAQRIEGLGETIDTLNKRIVTDPYDSTEPLVRPRESFTSRMTAVPGLGSLALKNKEKHSKDSESMEADRGTTEFDVAKGGLLAAARAILSDKRQYKQQRRQDRSKRVEKPYGTRIGRGKQSGLATRINRGNIWFQATKRFITGEVSEITGEKLTAKDRREMIKTKSFYSQDEITELKSRRARGEISGIELEQMLGNHGRVYTTPKAVRREVRKERVGAVYNSARSQQPVSENVRKVRRTSTEKRLEREQQRISRIDSRIAQLEAERRRREDDED